MPYIGTISSGAGELDPADTSLQVHMYFHSTCNTISFPLVHDGADKHLKSTPCLALPRSADHDIYNKMSLSI